VQLGISSYTFNWWAGVPGYAPPDPLTPMRLLEEAQIRRIKVVQIADNLPLDRLSAEELDSLARTAARFGISLETGTRGIAEDILERYLAISQRLGSRMLRTMVDGPESDAVGRLRDSIREYERAGVVLGIENHDRLHAAELRRIVDRVGSPALGICLDTANSLGCGEGLATVLAELLSLTVNVHIKDFEVRRLPHGKGFRVTGTPAGRGLLNVPDLLGRLRAAGRDVNCILELWSEPEATVEESIAKENRWADESLRYLRSLTL
jgi:sugar phosphate isomerase/epimerase